MGAIIGTILAVVGSVAMSQVYVATMPFETALLASFVTGALFGFVGFTVGALIDG